MKYVAVMQAKDQQERLLSWFLYHFEQGFDTFIYFDDFSEDKSVEIANEISKKYGINIIIKTTDGIGDRASAQQSKNSNAYGGMSLVGRIIRSYNSAIKLIKQTHPNAVVAFIDIDEFLVPEANKKVVDVLEENLKKFNNHIYVQSFDVDDAFSLEENFYISSETSQKRWDFESRKNTVFKNRGKSIINLSSIQIIKELPNAAHTITDNGHEGMLLEGGIINHEILRIHHYRKPTLEKNIKLTEDRYIIDFANKIKQKYGI